MITDTQLKIIADMTVELSKNIDCETPNGLTSIANIVEIVCQLIAVPDTQLPSHMELAQACDYLATCTEDIEKANIK